MSDVKAPILASVAVGGVVGGRVEETKITTPSPGSTPPVSRPSSATSLLGSSSIADLLRTDPPAWLAERGLTWTVTTGDAVIPLANDNIIVDGMTSLYQAEYAAGTWERLKTSESVATMLRKSVRLLYLVHTALPSLQSPLTVTLLARGMSNELTPVTPSPSTSLSSSSSSSTPTATSSTDFHVPTHSWKQSLPSITATTTPTVSSSTISMPVPGTLVAFLTVSGDLNDPLLEDIIVHESQRSRGLGGFLITAMLHHPSVLAAATVDLYCRPSLVSYYERFAFVKIRGGVDTKAYMRWRRPTTTSAIVSPSSLHLPPPPSLSLTSSSSTSLVLSQAIATPLAAATTAAVQSSTTNLTNNNNNEPVSGAP
jgi:hypothetical protein